MGVCLVPAGMPPLLTPPHLKMSISWIVDWWRNSGKCAWIKLETWKELEGLLTLEKYYAIKLFKKKDLWSLYY